MRFEWDPEKNAANRAKHGIDFEDAARALTDPNRIERIDDRFAYREERLQALCLLNGRVLFVAYTLRGDTYRIIMARRASRDEQRRYFEG